MLPPDMLFLSLPSVGTGKFMAHMHASKNQHPAAYPRTRLHHMLAARLPHTLPTRNPTSSCTQILLSFDLDCCAVAYHRGRMYAHERAIRAFSTNTNIIDYRYNARRAAKYQLRGFGYVAVRPRFTDMITFHEARDAFSQVGNYGSKQALVVKAFWSSPQDASDFMDVLYTSIEALVATNSRIPMFANSNTFPENLSD